MPEDEGFIPIKDPLDRGQGRRRRPQDRSLHSEGLSVAGLNEVPPLNRSLAAFIAPEGSGDGGSGDFSEPAPCRGHMDCSQGLNERCLTLDPVIRSPRCECAPAFARNKLTSICQEKVYIQGNLLLTLPGDVSDSRALEQRAEGTLSAVVQNTRHTRYLAVEVRVVGVNRRVVLWRMSLAAGGVNATRAEGFLARELSGAIDRVGSHPGLLDLKGASFQQLAAEEPCQGQVNYCSTHAECISTPRDPSRTYRCRCRHQFADPVPTSSTPVKSARLSVHLATAAMKEPVLLNKTI